MPLNFNISSPKSLRQHLRQTFQLFKFLAGRRAAETIGNANRHLMLAPDFEDRLIIFGIEVIASGIANAGNAEPVHFAEEFLFALHLLVERWMGKLVEQSDGHIETAAVLNRSGWISGGIPLKFSRSRQVRFAVNSHGFEAQRRHHFPIVTKLHVNGIVRHGRDEVRLRRPPFFLELFRVPTARDNQPRARLFWPAKLRE